MAVNLQGRGLMSVGKRFLIQISSRRSSLSTSPFVRTVQVSAYDKNPEEPVQYPTLMPDDVILPKSDKYWAPHPQTGVFGPHTENQAPEGGKRGFQPSAETESSDSVLEQKAFFRPLEDLEKPAPQPGVTAP